MQCSAVGATSETRRERDVHCGRPAAGTAAARAPRGVPEPPGTPRCSRGRSGSGTSLHTHTHTHTHTYTYIHISARVYPSPSVIANTLTHTHSLTHTYSLTHTHSYTFSLTHTHSLSHTHSHTHSLTHSLTHTHTHSHILTHILTHSHTHSHTHCLPVRMAAREGLHCGAVTYALPKEAPRRASDCTCGKRARAAGRRCEKTSSKPASSMSSSTTLGLGGE